MLIIEKFYLFIILFLVLLSVKYDKFLLIYSILSLIYLAFRTFYIQHPPFSNIYETFLFISFLFSVKLLLSNSEIRKNVYLKIPIIIFILIAIFISEEKKQFVKLPEILKSPWFFIHVPSFFISYLSIFISFILSLSKKSSYNQVIDQELRISLIFMMIGLWTGAMWGYVSWGSFWNWDPKEISSLITIILVFLAYFERNKILTKKIYIWLSFAMLLWTYFGVTFILKGLHSY